MADCATFGFVPVEIVEDPAVEETRMSGNEDCEQSLPEWKTTWYRHPTTILSLDNIHLLISP
jgi:hypothetical protein